MTDHQSVAEQLRKAGGSKTLLDIRYSWDIGWSIVLSNSAPNSAHLTFVKMTSNKNIFYILFEWRISEFLNASKYSSKIDLTGTFYFFLCFINQKKSRKICHNQNNSNKKSCENRRPQAKIILNIESPSLYLIHQQDKSLPQVYWVIKPKSEPKHPSKFWNRNLIYKSEK